MSPLDAVIRGTRILGADGLRERSIGISAGVVVAIEGYDADLTAPHMLDLRDDEVLIPGLVDTHVHVNEPGRTEWEGFETATRAAAAGGVTTVVDMPLNAIPPTLDVPSLEVKRQAAQGKCHVDVGFWGGAVPSNLGSLRKLHEAGAIGFKCFLLDSGVPEFPPLLGPELEIAMREIAEFDGLLVVHAEDGATIAAAPVPQGRSYQGFLDSRPPESETRAVDSVIAGAVRTRVRAHIAHLSSADALSAVRAARADGVRLTAETCPHYLTLSADQVDDGQTQFKCCPPIRDDANRERLWGALVDGIIDLVVSDHSPSTPELKCLDSGDFGAAWGGVSSLQIGLPLVWTEARRRGHRLDDVVGWMSTAPAALVGLSRKGRIEVGCDADLVVFAPDEPLVVEVGSLHHRHPVSPYSGQRLQGVVRSTWLRGQVVSGTSPHGELISAEGA